MQFEIPSRQTLDSALSLLETSDQRLQLAQITVPYLRIYGKLDGLVPRGVIAQIDQLAKHSDKYLFEGSSHAPFISEQTAFVEQLSAWVIGQENNN